MDFLTLLGSRHSNEGVLNILSFNKDQIAKIEQRGSFGSRHVQASSNNLYAVIMRGTSGCERSSVADKIAKKFETNSWQVRIHSANKEAAQVYAQEHNLKVTPSVVQELSEGYHQGTNASFDGKAIIHKRLHAAVERDVSTAIQNTAQKHLFILDNTAISIRDLQDSLSRYYRNGVPLKNIHIVEVNPAANPAFMKNLRQVAQETFDDAGLDVSLVWRKNIKVYNPESRQVLLETNTIRGARHGEPALNEQQSYPVKTASQLIIDALNRTRYVPMSAKNVLAYQSRVYWEPSESLLDNIIGMSKGRWCDSRDKDQVPLYRDKSISHEHRHDNTSSAAVDHIDRRGIDGDWRSGREDDEVKGISSNWRAR